jgi:hypothetical protein
LAAADSTATEVSSPTERPLVFVQRRLGGRTFREV